MNSTQSGRVDGLGPVHLALAQLAMQGGDLPTAEQQIRQALAYALQLQLTAQGLNGLWHWAQYLWAAGQRDQAVVLLGYLLHHKNTSGFLAWEINTFLTTHRISLNPTTSSEDVGWQAWLQSKLRH